MMNSRSYKRKRLKERINRKRQRVEELQQGTKRKDRGGSFDSDFHRLIKRRRVEEDLVVEEDVAVFELDDYLIGEEETETKQASTSQEVGDEGLGSYYDSNGIRSSHRIGIREGRALGSFYVASLRRSRRIANQ